MTWIWRAGMSAAAGIGAGDCLIAVSASGSTPYALAALDEAREEWCARHRHGEQSGCRAVSGCRSFAFCCRPRRRSCPDRRAWGRVRRRRSPSTCFRHFVGIHLGHVHDGHMVNLKADNAKLRGPAIRIVSDIAGDRRRGGRLLSWQLSPGSVKIAILLAAGARDVAAAQAVLTEAGQSLRRALSLVSAH